MQLTVKYCTICNKEIAKLSVFLLSYQFSMKIWLQLFILICLTDQDVYEEHKMLYLYTRPVKGLDTPSHRMVFLYFYPPHITPPPPPCFAGGSMHVETYYLPFLRCTKT